MSFLTLETYISSKKSMLSRKAKKVFSIDSFPMLYLPNIEPIVGVHVHSNLLR